MKQTCWETLSGFKISWVQAVTSSIINLKNANYCYDQYTTAESILSQQNTLLGLS